MYIKIKVGHYNETIFIEVKKTNITIVGDGRDNMIISGNKSNVGCFNTFETAFGKSFIIILIQINYMDS